MPTSFGRIWYPRARAKALRRSWAPEPGWTEPVQAESVLKQGEIRPLSAYGIRGTKGWNLSGV